MSERVEGITRRISHGKFVPSAVSRDFTISVSTVAAGRPTGPSPAAVCAGSKRPLVSVLEPLTVESPPMSGTGAKEKPAASSAA